jgi:TP901 family phage tail tape measure protein
VTAWREFEDALAEVDTMLQGTAEDYLPEMRTAIEDLSVQWGKSANDMARGMYQVLSASVDAAQAISVLEVAATAAVAGLTSVETAVDAITTVLNAYGEGASKASHISDVMFKTVQRGKLRFEEMAASMAYTVSIASKAGIAFEEIGAAMATMTKQGIKANMAARGLRMVIADMLSPSEEATKAASNYGITLGGLHLRVVGLDGIVSELTSALGTNAAAYAEIFPNVQTLSAVLALASEDAKLFKDDIKAMFEEAGGASAQAALEIVESGGFEAKATEQSLEKQKRDRGEFFDDIVLGYEKMVASIATLLTKTDVAPSTRITAKHLGIEVEGLDEGIMANLKEIWTIDEQIAATKAELVKEWYKGIAAAKDESEQFKQNVAGAVAYAEANKYLSTTLDMTEKELIDNADAMDEAAIIMSENATAFYEAKDYVEGLSTELVTLKATTAMLTAGIEKLDTEIAALNEKISQVSAIKKAEGALKGLEKQYRALQRASWEYGMTNKKLSLEMMQIELTAMGKRGRYGRTDRKRMEEIQKEQLQNRIEQAKIGIETDYFKEDELKPAMERLANLRELQDTELEDLRNTLDDKISDKNTYLDDLKIVQDKEIKTVTKHLKALKALYAQYRAIGATAPSYVMKGMVSGIVDIWGANIPWAEKWKALTGQAQTGISNVGQTGIYKLHEGETVLTKGATNAGIGGGRVTVDLSGTLNVNLTRHIGVGDDPEAWVAKKISDGVRRGLIKTDIDTMYG